jgi:hypothetical protein
MPEHTPDLVFVGRLLWVTDGSAGFVRKTQCGNIVSVCNFALPGSVVEQEKQPKLGY